MTLMMSGLDYQRTPLNQRQRLAFSTSQAEELLHWLHNRPGVEGCVLLSTAPGRSCISAAARKRRGDSCAVVQACRKGRWRTISPPAVVWMPPGT